jgi:hypothetical protein
MAPITTSDSSAAKCYSIVMLDLRKDQRNLLLPNPMNSLTSTPWLQCLIHIAVALLPLVPARHPQPMKATDQAILRPFLNLLRRQRGSRCQKIQHYHEIILEPVLDRLAKSQIFIQWQQCPWQIVEINIADHQGNPQNVQRRHRLNVVIVTLHNLIPMSSQIFIPGINASCLLFCSRQSSCQ